MRNHGTFGTYFSLVNQQLLLQLGVWHFLLPTSLVVVGFCPFDLLTLKAIKTLVLGAGDSVAHYQLLVSNRSLAFSRESSLHHSRMAMWIILLAPKGSFKQYFALVESLVPLWSGSSCILSLPFSSCFLDPNNVFGHWALLANFLIYLVQSYQVEEGLFGRSVRWRLESKMPLLF